MRFMFSGNNTWYFLDLLQDKIVAGETYKVFKTLWPDLFHLPRPH